MKTFTTPSHFDASRKEEVYKVNYDQLAKDAVDYKAKHSVTNASTDSFKVALMNIDTQNTFCIPGFELFVDGAPDDSARLASYIYGNIGRITSIYNTMDTHKRLQIFHPAFFVNDAGDFIPAYTVLTSEDLKTGKWKVNPGVASTFKVDYTWLTKHVISYCEKLEAKNKLQLTIWPYHARLMGIGHAVVSLIEEASCFHEEVRNTETGVEIKGGNPLTENYSVLSPEILTDGNNDAIAQKNSRFIEKLMKYDMVVIAGQAKSHCVAWTIEDLLTEIASKDPALAKKVYILEDCTSPVIIPNVVDFTVPANEAFERFKAAGMNIVKSTDPMDTWPGVDASKFK